MWQGVRRSGRPALLLLIAALGCADQSPETPPADRYRSLAVGWKSHTDTEHRGVMKADTLVWVDQDLAACLGLLGFGNQPARPVCLVFARTVAGRRPETPVEIIGPMDIVRFQTFLGPDHTRGPAFTYQVEPADKKEVLVAAGREYPLSAGRVFLIDATKPTLAVHQIGVGLGGYFDAPGPDFEKLAAEVQTLRQADARVRRFWAGEDPEAEDAGS